MCSDLLPDMLYNQLQREEGPEIVSRKKILIIERDPTFEDCYV